MTPQTQQQIVDRINRLEAKFYGLYVQLEALRLDLQEQWKVLPGGERWTQERHDATMFSARDTTKEA